MSSETHDDKEVHTGHIMPMTDAELDEIELCMVGCRCVALLREVRRLRSEVSVAEAVAP